MGQTKRTCYATSAQIRRLRKKMRDIMTKEVSKCPLREVVKKLIPESMGKEITKSCLGICPVEHVFMRKVKIVKKPKFDLTKLMELHTDSKDDGAVMGRPEAEEAVNTLT